MKRLLLILAILLSTTSSFAQTGSPVQFSGGGKFKGGTLTSNLTMSDGTIIELATGSATNLSLRFRSDPDTGIYSSAPNDFSVMTGGVRRFFVNANAFYIDGNLPLTGPGNAVGVIYMPTGTSGAKGLYTWKLDTNATIRYVGVGPASTTVGAANPAMYSDNGTINPTKAQVWASTTSNLNVALSHTIASTGYTIYQGNAAYSATGEDYVTLPVNIAATSIAFDAGATGYIRAEVSGKNSTDSSCIHVELKAEYENFDDTLAFVGSPASITSQLNAATWSVVLSAADDDLSILATGTPGTIWQVKKLEIGGL